MLHCTLGALRSPRNFISNIIQWLACCCNAKREHKKDLVSTLFVICKCWITVDLSVVGGCYFMAMHLRVFRLVIGQFFFHPQCMCRSVCAPFSRLLFYIKPLDQHFFWIRVIMQNTQYSARNRMHSDRMIDTLAIELTLCETLENPKYDRQIWLEWWPSSLHDTLPYGRQNAAVWCRYLLANLQCILNIWLLSLRNEKGPIWMIAFVKYTHFDRLICMLAASFT